MRESLGRSIGVGFCGFPVREDATQRVEKMKSRFYIAVVGGAQLPLLARW